ncbi:hypothetical protein K490DRAFT_75870 [Saccharata proteae CBS 121410]|uniref:MICOS complex subunit MIC60 n=1 Tax=Saccharata proteae CBS 121410 TaxID=1314787 RepID=A0A9P4HRW3_9PEZI|nr:hypothetical protein K490DRAFT_75870 [Saccharata proteae CBS 121410]
MLRIPLTRSSQLASRAVASRNGAQWRATQRVGAAGFGQRYFAETRKPDENVLPGSQSAEAVGNVASPPPLNTTPVNPSLNGIPQSEIPLTPPTPQSVGSDAPKVGPTGQLPPTGTGTASVAPPPQAPKPKKRFRRFLLTLLVLTSLGYGGGVYYSLVSDNFHDFFTEYVPFGEDAVGYFEERQFRRRFPGGTPAVPRLHEQVRGENKIKIASKSGVSWKKTEEEGKESAQKDKKTSAVEDAGRAERVQQAPTVATQKEQAVTVEEAKKPAAKPAEPVKSTPAGLIDNINIKEGSEPVVQDVVKILNDIITVINADNAADKYSSAITKAKSEISKVVNDIATMKAMAEKQSEDKIRNLHIEFDNGVKELVRRVETEMHQQEAHWKDEFESERERLSQTYQSKLKAELDAAQKVYDQKVKNSLLEQSIELQRQFTDSVRKHVDEERGGRLARLTELSDSVAELEKLTAQWNEVIDANLRTQHMVVAVEAARAAVEKADRPRPFVEELAALKEVAANDPVVNAAIASINPVAYQRGVPTPSQLIDRFRRVASEVRKAALLPEDAGVASHAASLVLSKVMFKKGGQGQGLPVGTDVEAVLTRTEMLLEEGNIDQAAREMNGLTGWAKVLARDWLGDARRVLEVRQALDVLSTEARLQSLLVD